MSRIFSVRSLIFASIALVAVVVAAPAQANTLSSATVTVPQAVKQTCNMRLLPAGPGVVTRAARAPGLGLFKVRLEAASGDWDLGVFDAKTHRKVAGSAHFGATELAEGLVTKNQRLVVQACRLAGSAATARITTEFEKLVPAKHPVQIVRVSTPTRAAKNKLTSLGLDVTEHAGPDYIDVVIHNPVQALKLGKAGFISTVVVRDLNKRNRAERLSTARRASDSGPLTHGYPDGVPSGRDCPNPPARLPGDCYRMLDEYSQELKDLADDNPTFVKAFALPAGACPVAPGPPCTYEGRKLEGIEIATNVNAQDGRPVFLMMGLHHAREWPSGEHTIEWAYELINGYKADPNSRAGQLVQNTRTLIIPAVNPDGFNVSRVQGEGYGHGAGHDGVTGNDLLAFPGEYRRKNCRLYYPAGPPPANVGTCAQPTLGLAGLGVDPNRNYGTFWGGPGSGFDPTSETFHGPHCTNDEPVEGPGCGPFSEPETEQIRQLISTRHVTTLITNHTYTGLVLRAPGLASQGLAPDEPAMKALGDAMASKNGYVSQYGWQLYDTTGTTEDWSYNTTGGYGYTFEIGKRDFHPAYQKTIAEWEGTSTFFTQNGGNREAYYLAHENTANPVHHSVLTGTALAGAVLRLKKVVQTPTSIKNADGSAKTFTDTLDTTLPVPVGPAAPNATSTYTWHINPSTRPLVMQTRGRPADGAPSPPQTFSGIVGPTNALPCGAASGSPTCYRDHAFTVPGNVAGVIDNAYATIRLEWATIASDWDLFVYRDINGNGVKDPADPEVGKSDQPTTDFEQVTLKEPFGGTTYIARAVNYAATEPYEGSVTFRGPESQLATTESWTLTCEETDGTVLSTQQVVIARGEQKTVNVACGSPTAVRVASFAAYRGKGGVTLAWRTQNEQNIAGFNVYRGTLKLNRALIRAKATGKLSSVSYRFVDRTARPSGRHTYRLQVVGLDGKRTWRGVAIVRARA